MHLSCASSSASQLCILISVAHLYLDASRSQFVHLHLDASPSHLRNSILMHLDLSCTSPSASQLRILISVNTRSPLHISILMHLSCASVAIPYHDAPRSQLRISISISVAHLHLNESLSQMYILISMHLNLSCTSPSLPQLRISISIYLDLSCISPSQCISISVTRLVFKAS